MLRISYKTLKYYTDKTEYSLFYLVVDSPLTVWRCSLFLAALVRKLRRYAATPAIVSIRIYFPIYAFLVEARYSYSIFLWFLVVINTNQFFR